MTKRFLTISDIHTSEILYYDPNFKGRCYKYCAKRDIDCLPALDKPRKIFVRNPTTSSFQEKYMATEKIVEEGENIFTPSLLKRFSANPLLFVMRGDALIGVVHFSDYNKSVVSIYLYELLLAHEQNLRAVLIKEKRSNRDMISYFEYKQSKANKEEDVKRYKDKILDFERKKDKNDKRPEFEPFYLLELITLINHKKIMKLNELTNLRNAVMHANEFVNMQDRGSDDLIYDIKTFKKFFESVLQLQYDYKLAGNYLAFKEE